MPRTFAAALCALAVCSGSLLAEEIKGKVKSVDADKGTITVTVDGKDHTLMAKDAKFSAASGKALADGLKDKHLKAGADVVITCEKKDGKEICSEVKLAQPRPKK